jgi:hypothetical protein
MSLSDLQQGVRFEIEKIALVMPVRRCSAFTAYLLSTYRHQTEPSDIKGRYHAVPGDERNNEVPYASTSACLYTLIASRLDRISNRRSGLRENSCGYNGIDVQRAR